jgi:hypothetical protein
MSKHRWDKSQRALGSMKERINTPVLHDDLNVKWIIYMLDAARANKIIRFVYAFSFFSRNNRLA